MLGLRDLEGYTGFSSLEILGSAFLRVENILLLYAGNHIFQQ